MSVIVICHNGFLELEIKARFIKRWYMEKTLVIAMHPEGEKKKTTKPRKTVITFQSAFGDNSGGKNLPKRKFIG